MTKKSVQLPKTIFIKMEQDDDTSISIAYPVASIEMAELLDTSQTVKVGTYTLVEIHDAEFVVSKTKINK